MLTIVVNPDVPDSLKRMIVLSTMAMERHDVEIDLTYGELVDPDHYLLVMKDRYKVYNETAVRYLKSQVALVMDEEPIVPLHRLNPDSWVGEGIDHRYYGDPWHHDVPEFVPTQYRGYASLPLQEDGPDYMGKRIPIFAMPEGFNPSKAQGFRY